MKKVTLSEFEEAEKGAKRCILIVQCTRVRACKWEGLESQYGTERINSIESKCVCPRCGNDEFYTKYEPIHNFKFKYVKE